MIKKAVLLALSLFLTSCTMAPSRAMVSFTFDDGYLSTYTEAFPILSDHSFPATVYMVTDNLSRPERLNISHLRELADAGWEIGSHSVTHANLTHLPDEDLLHEITHSKQILTTAGFATESFAPPGGAADERVTTLVRRHYTSLRTTHDGYNLPPPDPYNLLVKATFGWTTANDVKEWLNEATQQDAWLILVCHHIDDTNGTYTMSPQTLQEIALYIKNEQIPVVTVSEGLKRFE